MSPFQNIEKYGKSVFSIYIKTQYKLGKQAIEIFN